MTFLNTKLLLLGIVLSSSFYLTELFAQEKDSGIAILDTLIKPTSSLSNKNFTYKLKEEEKSTLKTKSNKIAENLKKKQAAKHRKIQTIKKTREFSDNLPTKHSQNFDVERAVKTLNRNARGKSTGYCAKYVRLALEAGGLKMLNHPSSASDYDKYLPSLGFQKLEKDEHYVPKKGDIVVTKAFKGNKNHPYGHISMYNGEQWVSDFKQKDIWAGSDYRSHKPKQIIFRKG